MKAITLLGVAAIMWAVMADGQLHGQPTGNTNGPAVPSGTNTVSERKTVEKNFPAGTAKTNLREQLKEFQRDGWLVVSVSKPSTQPDGTVNYKFVVQRPKRTP